MYWKIIVIISLTSSWKYWQRGVSACPTLSIDVHLGPPSSTVWYQGATWTYSMTRQRKRRLTHRITHSRTSTSRPTRAAMLYCATRMSSGGPMASRLTTLTLLTIKVALPQGQPIQTTSLSGASKQTSMEWTWVISKLMMKLGLAGRPPASSSLSMTVAWLTQRRLGISQASRVIVRGPLLNQYYSMSHHQREKDNRMRKIHWKSTYCTTSNHYRTLSRLVKQDKVLLLRLLCRSRKRICLKCTIALTMEIGLKSRNSITKPMCKKLYSSRLRPQTMFLNQELIQTNLKMMKKIMVWTCLNLSDRGRKAESI